MSPEEKEAAEAAEVVKNLNRQQRRHLHAILRRLRKKMLRGERLALLKAKREGLTVEEVDVA